MNIHVSFSSLGLFQKLPPDVKNIICDYIPENEMQSCCLEKKSRDEFYKKLQEETSQKIGLYQKNLMLEGIPYVIQKNEIMKNSLAKEHWNSAIKQLFLNAIKDGKSNSRSLLESLSNVNNSAKEALDQLNGLGVLKKDNDIEQKIEAIREKRLAEKFIYKFCGGKKKFNDLKILDLNEENSHIFFNKIESIKHLHAGCSVMRGMFRDESYFDDYPFIAFQYKEQIGSILEEKIAFFQEYSGREGNWYGDNLPSILGPFEGSIPGSLQKRSKYCHLSSCLFSSFFGRFKELITTSKTANDQCTAELVY